MDGMFTRSSTNVKKKSSMRVSLKLYDKYACVPETETSILSLTKCKTPLVYDVYASALHRELQGGISIFGDGRTHHF